MEAGWTAGTGAGKATPPVDDASGPTSTVVACWEASWSWLVRWQWERHPATCTCQIPWLVALDAAAGGLGAAGGPGTPSEAAPD